MKKKIALFHKEWSDPSVRMMEGIFSLPEIRQRCEFRDFPLPRGGREIVLPGSWRPDGVVFTLDEGDPRGKVIASLGVPAVRIDGEWAVDPFPAVTMDLLSMVNQSLKHFDRLSCPNLLFVGPSRDARCRRIARLLARRARGTQIRCLRAAFFRPTEESSSRVDQDLEAHPEIERVLQEMETPFGVITLREADAIFMLNACRERGLRVPNDIGILTASDTPTVQFCDPPITALAIDYLEMGRKAIALLEDLMAGNDTGNRRYRRVKFTGINARASTLGDSPIDQNIERVRQMIQSRACEGITVEEILSHLDISRPTLEKRYRELTGMSPAQHIRQLRAARARELLLTTNLSITQISRRIGFDDPRPFMVFFKREFGQTPGSYRMAHS